MNQAAPDKWKPVIIGGVVMGVLSALPIIGAINCACCILVIGGGALASYLYQKDFPPGLPGPNMGDGALIGLLAGLIGAVVDSIVSIPITLLGIGAAQMASALDMLRSSPDIPPEVIGLLESMVAGGAIGIGLLIGLVFSLVIFAIFGTLGGILGVAIFQKGSSAPPSAPAAGPPQTYEPPAPDGYQPPPEPPTPEG